MSERARCELCGDPMPPGEEMFKYHGYSGPCPKLPLPRDSGATTAPHNEAELQWVVDNIFTIARREYRRVEDGKPLRPEMWGHVLRLCEKAGCHTRTVGVLRTDDPSVSGEATPLTGEAST